MKKIGLKQIEISEIYAGWKQCRLGELIDTVSETYQFNGGQVCFLNTSDISNGHVINHNLSDVKTLPGQAKKSIKKNDFLFSEIRPANRRFALIDFDSSNYVVSTKLMVLRCGKEIIPKYLKYFLTSKDILEELQILAESRSGTFPQITFTQVANLNICLPQISEQQTIIKILSDLDEKIELNQQMNKTLETMAQALFKQWFVDFEFPGYESIKFVNGLPEGWNEGRLVDVCNIVMGQSPPGETYNESRDGMVFYQGNRDFGVRFPTPRVYCTAPTRIAESGDILISVRAPVGALNIALEQCAIGRGVAGLKMKHFSNGFLFYFLLTQNNLWNRYNSEGTVFGCLNKTEFYKLKTIIPSDEIMIQFDKIITPIEEMIRTNEKEIRALTQIRDSLLPGLVSGWIRTSWK